MTAAHDETAGACGGDGECLPAGAPNAWLKDVSGAITIRQRSDGARKNLWPPRKSWTNPRDEEILTFDAPGRSWAYAVWKIPSEHTKRSHINFCVFDSTWEASEAFELDRNKAVAAWVKNHHLGFEVIYVYRGAVRKYRPDFLIRLTNGTMLVLEVKGQDSQEDKAKRQFFAEWVDAVNARGGFGRWAWDVSFSTDDLSEVLSRYGSTLMTELGCRPGNQ